MVDKLKTYMRIKTKDYDREELVDFLAVSLADNFARLYSMIQSGAEIDREIYVGMHILLCGKGADNIKFSKTEKDYVDYIAELFEKYKVDNENKGIMN